jgi:hypothetical protein
MSTVIEVSEDVTNVTASGDNISVNITDDVTKVDVSTLAISTTVPGTVSASNVTVTPYGTVTATNLATAIQQLADQDFRSDTAPTGATVSEGDTWYDTDDNQFKVYRETSSGVFQWVPLLVGGATGDSDTLDAGSY